MILVNLKGGLGNQMFQYALGRVLSLKNNTELVLDTSYFEISHPGATKREYALDIFEINNETKKCFKIIFFIKNIFSKKERFFNFDPKILMLKDGVCLDGYWQSYKYFKNFEDVIRKDFTLKRIFSENIEGLAKKIKSENSVCVHIRRGDYIGNKLHDVLGFDYYERGLKEIEKRVKISNIYVFSDDIAWCKKNIKLEHSITFVGDEYSGQKAGGHLYLMSQCKNFLISNSTFSWWAAWLAENSHKVVVCPNKWFGDESINTNDLIPEDWIRI